MYIVYCIYNLHIVYLPRESPGSPLCRDPGDLTLAEGALWSRVRMSNNHVPTALLKAGAVSCSGHTCEENCRLDSYGNWLAQRTSDFKHGQAALWRGGTIYEGYVLCVCPRLSHSRSSS